jgi:LmbE family N-acetylglucosaminyl deacetylase
MDIAKFDSSSRLILFAPHPDDEALACSVILQQAVRAGAAIRVVYVTDGDDNPWPQRALERKWSLSPSDRQRWGKLRRAEALAALRVLDIVLADVQFLGLPDQGLTDLLLRDCDTVLTRITQVIDDWSPTDILAPSLFDIHPDHNAVAVMMRLIFDDFSAPRISQWNYLVHGRSRVLRQCRGIIILRIRDRQKMRSNSLPSNANQTVEATFP